MTNTNYDHLMVQIKEVIVQARNLTIRNINSLQVASNFMIGYQIVEFEQKGATQAEYGKETTKNLSKELTKLFGRGYSKSNLEYMRRFYLRYIEKGASIAQTLSGQLTVDKNTQTPSGHLHSNKDVLALTQNVAKSFPLSWSHYICLLSIRDNSELSFYEIEANNQNWSLRELKRQLNSSLYERLALSREKDAVKKLSKEGQQIGKAEDVLKSPYVLEFLGLDEKSKYSESDLETAIIDKLEHFLLELGKGFLFEARQRRFTFDEDHYFVDLVFYNRLLRCYTLVDLKIGELTHQDLGQMQMYVNYFDRYEKLEGENPTIGIILCKRKKESLVEITLPQDANIHAAEYQLYLPSKEALKKQLEEAQQAWEDQQKK